MRMGAGGILEGLHSPQTVGGLCTRPQSGDSVSSSPSLEPENSHIPDTSTRGASQGSSEAASVAAEDAVTQTPSTRVDAAKEAIAG